MCFCGPFLSLSTLVILLVDDQCLQKHVRLKGNHWLPSKFSDVYVSLLSLKTSKGKTLVKKQASSNISIPSGKFSSRLTQECMTFNTLVLKEGSNGPESGNSLMLLWIYSIL